MRCKEDDRAAAEAASLAAEHGATRLTPQRDGARGRSSDFFNGLLETGSLYLFPVHVFPSRIASSCAMWCSACLPARAARSSAVITPFSGCMVLRSSVTGGSVFK